MAGSDLQFGLVGLGQWGRNIYRTVSTLKGMTVRAVSTRGGNRTDLVSDACARHTDWRDLVSRGDLDGIFLAVPPKVQKTIAFAAIEAGIPVFLEKPVAISVENVDALRCAAKSANAIVFVDHVYRFHPGFRKLSKLAAVDGPVEGFSSIGGNRGPVRSFVDPLWDWAPHDVSMCLSILKGDIVSVRARPLEPEVDIPGCARNYKATIQFSDGASAHMTFGNAMPARIRKATVRVPSGSITFDDRYRHLDIADRKGRLIDRKSCASRRALSVAVRRFSTLVEKGKPDISELDFAVDVTAVIEAMQKSIAGNCDVALSGTFRRLVL